MSDLMVSPQHRILVRSNIVQKMIGASEALVAAKHLVGIDGIEQDFDETEIVDYFHFLFDHHEVVFAEGLPAESLYTGERALRSVGEAARSEILFLFPEIQNTNDPISPPARVFLSGRQGRKMVHRHRKNNKRLLQNVKALSGCNVPSGPSGLVA